MLDWTRLWNFLDERHTWRACVELWVQGNGERELEVTREQHRALASSPLTFNITLKCPPSRFLCRPALPRHDPAVSPKNVHTRQCQRIYRCRVPQGGYYPWKCRPCRRRRVWDGWYVNASKLRGIHRRDLANTTHNLLEGRRRHVLHDTTVDDAQRPEFATRSHLFTNQKHSTGIAPLFPRDGIDLGKIVVLRDGFAHIPGAMHGNVIGRQMPESTWTTRPVSENRTRPSCRTKASNIACAPLRHFLSSSSEDTQPTPLHNQEFLVESYDGNARRVSWDPCGISRVPIESSAPLAPIIVLTADGRGWVGGNRGQWKGCCFWKTPRRQVCRCADVAYT